MEKFLQDISLQLQHQSDLFSLGLESDQKLLAIQTFKCMTNCFEQPGPLSSSKECADKCDLSMQQAQAHIQQNILYIQTAFQNCMKGCALKNTSWDNTELKSCIIDCRDQALENFQTFQATSINFIRQYLD